jgi:hypothetical protein
MGKEEANHRGSVSRGCARLGEASHRLGGLAGTRLWLMWEGMPLWRQLMARLKGHRPPWGIGR